jgi:hypothetical protein
MACLALPLGALLSLAPVHRFWALQAPQRHRSQLVVAQLAQQPGALLAHLRHHLQG